MRRIERNLRNKKVNTDSLVVMRCKLNDLNERTEVSKEFE